MTQFRKVAQYRTIDELSARLHELGLELPIDTESLSEAQESPLARTQLLELTPERKVTIGNRWCIHPMEGWDANTDGTPTEYTLRRWERFGSSGAKLIWGGEAAAVRPDGRANANQTLATENNRAGLKRLLDGLKQAHRQAGFRTEDLVVGLQLTHSGRFSRPNDRRLEPTIAWHHPVLDQRCDISPRDDRRVLTDEQIPTLIEEFAAAARIAADVGFDFVDIKACHGYLIHEFLGARERPGGYGGELAGRARLLLEVIEAVRNRCPELGVGVRLNAFDCLPFESHDGAGRPVSVEGLVPYRWGFGIDPERPTEYELSEVCTVMQWLRDSGVFAVNLTGGTPYTTPHWQRPAAFPPSDGYAPPEDPLQGVVRHLRVGQQLKQRVPGLVLVGSGYTYLQDYLVPVAQSAVRHDWIDLVGIGRMVLSYPTMPADSLSGAPPRRKEVCRTFSDCTTAPRNGLRSGCYPLDGFYKQTPEAEEVKRVAPRGNR
ncbi:MAG: NADH:flavin oxidoreductase [Pirellulaceae bacterium]|nr:NADH:flavin oxidoreductase [Planctomycetales bacterium]